MWWSQVFGEMPSSRATCLVVIPRASSPSTSHSRPESPAGRGTGWRGRPAAASKAVRQMERDERNGVPPGDVAVVVRRVLRSARPPRRVSVGKAGERVGLLAKRLLPFRAFEAAAKGSLGV